LIVQISKFDMA